MGDQEALAHGGLHSVVGSREREAAWARLGEGARRVGKWILLFQVVQEDRCSAVPRPAATNKPSQGGEGGSFSAVRKLE